MQAFGLARIGRDAELRNTPNGDAVTNLSLAFSWGAKDQSSGKRQTVWVDASLWNKRAEALAQYLTKGTLVSVTIDDLHMEAYKSANGEGTKLVGRIAQLELAGSPQTVAAPPAPRPPPPPPRPAPASPTTGFSDMDDDVPF